MKKNIIHTHPDIVKEWNYNKNNPLNPANFTHGSNKIVWWQCEKGHEWKTKINLRCKGSKSKSKGSGCPICSNQKILKGYNYIGTTHPDLMNIWHPTKNTNISPHNISHGYNKHVWWLCHCGYEWHSYIYNTTSSSCPACNNRVVTKKNSLELNMPKLVSEWDYSKNTIDISTVVIGSGKKVWWICSCCSHEWKARICDRTSRGHGCPKCANSKIPSHINSLEALRPDIAHEWHSTKNGNLTPANVFCNSNIQVWWQCKNGHEWFTNLKNRIAGTGCPKCNCDKTSFPQASIFYYIKKLFQDATLNYRFKNIFEIDIFIPTLSLAIEYDGYFWHKDTYDRDIKKNEILNKNDIYLIRVRESGLDKITKYSCLNIFSPQNPTNKQLSQLIKKLLLNIVNYDSKKELILKIDEILGEVDVKKDRLIIFKEKTFLKRENSLIFLNPSLAKEWHPTKNGKLVPENFAANSHEAVWWKCKCGYEWQDTIKERYRNNKICPKCRNNDVRFYNLGLLYPDIANQWHPTLNGHLSPNDIFPKTNKKFWWICENNPLHIWEASVNNRVRKNQGCPFCAGRLATTENNLTTYPNLMAIWDSKKNIENPKTLKKGSNKKVWWLCYHCGHSYQRIIANQTKSNRVNRCPSCKKTIDILNLT